MATVRSDTGLSLGALWLLLVCAASPAQETLRAALDPPQVYLGDGTVLTLKAAGELAGEELDLSPLALDFAWLGPTVFTQLRIVRGRLQSTTRWVIHLQPKRAGRLVVPGLGVAGLRSPTLSLGVLPRRFMPRPHGPPAVAELELRPGRPLVQAQTLLAVRLRYPDGAVLAGLQVAPPTLTDALLEPLGDARAGRPAGGGWRVAERYYALFAQRSGRLRLAPFILTASFGAGRGLPGGRLQLSTEPLEVAVRPRPAGYTGEHWLPAKRLTLSAAWQPPAVGFQVGQPAVLRLVLAARGLRAEQLPALNFPDAAQVLLYPEPPQLYTLRDGGDLVGYREQRITVLPQASGRVTLPGLSLDWWDIPAQQQRTARLAAQSLVVGGAP